MRRRHGFLLALLAPLVLLASGGGAAPAGVPVRYSEGTLHGFLELRTTADSVLAHGDLLQVPRDSDIESRLVFHFPDSSVFRETVVFTQHGVFELQSYHLVQTGPAFAQDLEVELTREGAKGRYVVKSGSHKDSGTIDLPVDAYNGMVITITKNLPAQTRRTVHIVAFTPKPLVLPLEITPSGLAPVSLGGRTESSTRFTLKPRLNLLQRIGAKLKAATPPDSYLWIVTTDVPAFVRFEGPLYSGPVWRINLTSPRWPK